MALLPPHFLNTVVALGTMGEDSKIQYRATGFLCAVTASEPEEGDKPSHRLYLVTNRHVVDSVCGTGSIVLRLNKSNDGGSQVYTQKTDEQGWTTHPDSDVDVAVCGVNVPVLNQDSVEYSYFASDSNCLTREEAKATGLSEGDGVFVLGFPLGDAGDERNYVIARYGIVARAQHWLTGGGKTFLIDAFVFPGNSGGPVLLKPELSAIKGTQSSKRCRLIGMVSSYIPYKDIAISAQTQEPRVIFHENSGLTTVVPYECIHETCMLASKNGVRVKADAKKDH